MKTKILIYLLAAATLLTTACTSSKGVDGPKAELTVSFSTELETYHQGDQIQFYGDAEVLNGEIATYHWHFGFRGDETNHADILNPKVIYPTGGSFTVKFTVTSTDGAVATCSKDIYVIPNNLLPSADFTYAPAEVIVGVPVTFTDASWDSDGEIADWAWDFGDTSTSSGQNPQHTYAADGFYQVKLTIIDNLGGADTKQTTVRVNAQSAQKEWKVLWSRAYSTGGVLATASAAVGDNGLVYAISSVGKLTAYDREGVQKWAFDLTKDGAVLSSERMVSPALDTDGSVFISCGDGGASNPAFLYAIDGATGTQKWKLAIGVGAYPDLQMPVVTNSYVTVGNHGTGGSLRIVDKITGAVKYAIEPSGGVYGGLCATRKNVFFSCAKNDRGYFTYIPSGDTWNISILTNNYGYGNSGKYTNPAIDASGNLYLAMCEGKGEAGGLVAKYPTSSFDNSTPIAAAWSYSTSAPITMGGCALGADGTVYALTESTATASGELIALTAAGAKKWSYATPAAATGVPAVDADGNVHYCDKSGYYTVLTSTGSVLYREKLADSMDTSPVISDYGVIYAQGQKEGGCWLYAIDIGVSGPAASDWAQRGRNARRCGVQK